MKLRPLGAGQGWLKSGLLGFAKGGKTYTATTLAIGVKNYFSLPGPIAYFDTESGSEYVVPRVKAETGQTPIGIKSRKFDDLIEVAGEADSGGVSVLIVDSITHPWRELMDSYLNQVNEQLAGQNRPLRSRLEFQDWNPIKQKWSLWTDFFLNSSLHIIICGRAGYDWDFQEREDGSGRDLIKTGIKMKTESEFGFEPSLLIDMERVQIRDKDDRLTKVFVRRATVIGDRFGVLDGQTCDNPDFEFFKPHIELLTPGAANVVDTVSQSDMGITDTGDSEHYARKRERTIILEEIQGEILRVFPGSTIKDKTSKANLIESVFQTRSWTKVETLIALEDLRAGLLQIRELVQMEVADANPTG